MRRRPHGLDYEPSFEPDDSIPLRDWVRIGLKLALTLAVSLAILAALGVVLGPCDVGGR